MEDTHVSAWCLFAICCGIFIGGGWLWGLSLATLRGIGRCSWLDRIKCCAQRNAGKVKRASEMAGGWPTLGQRIAVIAPHAGSGKTFVAQRLARALQLEYVSADALLWRNGDQPGDTPVFLSRAERLPVFRKALGGPGGWVVDGQFTDPKRAIGERRWHREIPDRCDTLVFLDLPRSTIFVQLVLRTIQRAWHGKRLHGGLWREGWRDVLCPGPESLLRHFVASGGGAADRALYQRIMADAAWAQVKVHLRSRRDVNAFLRSLEATAPCALDGTASSE